MEENTTQPQVDEINAQPQADVTPDDGLAGNEGTPTEQPAEQQSDATTNPWKLKIKYNGVEEELDEDTVRTLAQKGKNYDHVHTELEEKRKALEKYENDEGRKFLTDAAKRLGLTYGELVTRMKAEELRKQDAAKAAETKKPIEVVQALREKEEAKQEADRIKAQLAERERKEAADKAFADEMREFAKAHPDVKELPSDVAADISKGIPLTDAYEKYELKARIRELEEQTKVKETNDSNAAASTGALGSGPSKQGKLTQEDVLKMSPSEVSKLPDKVIHELFFQGG